MKYALVHKNEPVLDGFRICEVANTTFEVHKDLTWHQVADNISANTYYWKNSAPVLIPVIEKPKQPITQSLQ